MDKPKPNKVAQFCSGQIQPSGALSLRRMVRFWSGVDTLRQPEFRFWPIPIVENDTTAGPTPTNYQNRSLKWTIAVLINGD